MKSPLLLVGILSLLVVPFALSAVQAPGGDGKGSPAAAQGRAPGGKEPVGLEGGMKMLQGGLKRMQGALAANDFAQIAQIAVDMQRGAGAAKTETPWTAEKMADAAQKAEFVKSFRLAMIDLQRNLLDLEVAALSGKGDDVKKIVEEKLKPMRDAGHEKYNPEK